MTARKVSRGQISRIQELSHRLLGHANVAFAICGQPTTAEEASMILHALDAAGTPVLADEHRRRRILADTWKYLHEGGEPMTADISRKRKASPKREVSTEAEEWWQWAARRIGLQPREVERPCPRCEGTGTLTRTLPVTKGQVVRALVDLKPTTGASDHHVLRLRNPRLEDLERIAAMIGGDLDTAVEFCRHLVELVEGDA